jgi:hypothetical protein
MEHVSSVMNMASVLHDVLVIDRLQVINVLVVVVMMIQA